MNKQHATLDEAIALDAAEYTCLLVTRAKSKKAPFPLQAVEELFLEAIQKGRRIGHLPITGVTERRSEIENQIDSVENLKACPFCGQKKEPE